MQVTIYLVCLAVISSVCLAAKKRSLLDADNDGNYCYSDGDNIDLTAGDGSKLAKGQVIDDENEQRADFLKCIPPNSAFWPYDGSYVYQRLYELHHKMCIHVDMTFSDELNKKLLAFDLGRPPFYCDPTVDFEATYGDNCYGALYHPFEVNFRTAINNSLLIFDYQKSGNHPHLQADCACNKYARYNFSFVSGANNEVSLESIKFEREGEAEVHYELNDVTSCSNTSSGDEEGAFCLYTLNKNDLNTLPANQQNGFDNTDFKQEVQGTHIMLSSVDPLVSAGAQDLHWIYASQTNPDTWLTHCHFTPSNSGWLRIKYQHEYERRYPHQWRRRCMCDWRSLGNLVKQCDCTKDGTQNNGCGAAEAAKLQTVGVTCNNCNN
eukprot:Platyproteum_vivax@DN7584_c30_g2_i1.p1